MSASALRSPSRASTRKARAGSPDQAPRGEPHASTTLKAHELAALTARGVTRTFRKQTVVVSEGDDTDAFYVVLSGRVKIFVSDENGKEIVLATQGPGEYFGEIAADEAPRCASMLTLEPTRIAIIPRDRFLDFLLEHPQVAVKIFQKLVRQLRSLTEKVKSLGLVDVYGRVARLLVELSSLQSSTRVIERMTQQEIANRVGASREMVSRVLKDLCARGYIQIDKKHITVVKAPPLAW